MTAQVPRKPGSKMAMCLLATSGISIVSKLGLGLIPLLWHHPWALVALTPLPPFLARSAVVDPLWLYLVVGLLRSNLPNPIDYYLGRYGNEWLKRPKSDYRTHRFAIMRWFGHVVHWANTAIRWITRPVRPALVWLVRVVARLFPRYGYIFIILRPNGWMMLLAGALGLRPRNVALASLLGTLLWLILVGFMADFIPYWALTFFSFF